MKEDKVEYEVLNTMSNEEKIDVLFSLYKKDPYKARVLYMNDTEGYHRNRIVLFKGENGDFDIVYFSKKFGISKTNRIYNSEKRLLSVKYKDGKFWLISNSKGSRILTLTLSSLGQYLDHNSNFTVIVDYLINNGFSWIKFMQEKSIMHRTAFNSIIEHKVYSYKKALRHIYKIPAPQAKLIHEADDGTRYNKIMKSVVHYLEYLDNVEALRAEWVTGGLFQIFYDSLRMAKTTGNKINCSWSNKRLKLEHGKWAEIITDVIYIDGDRPLKIDDVYNKFEEFSGFKLLKTTKDMAIEGKRQSHCVASYINKVDRGNCGIYHVKGYTLEFGRLHNKEFGKHYDMLQFKGIGNEEPPTELIEAVKYTIEEFRKINPPLTSSTTSNVVTDDISINIDDLCVNADEDLPF